MKDKIAVIGGAGKSGIYLVKALLRHGFPLRVLLLHPENFTLTNPLIEIVPGDVRDYKTVESLFEGCRAVVSTLGYTKGETVPVFSAATLNIIKAMKVHQINRYVVTTGLNVDTPEDHKSPQTQFATDWMRTNYPQSTLDKQVEYEELVKSDVDWTLVRLPMINQTDEMPEIKVSLEDCPGDKISATSLAEFIIRQLPDETYVRQAPFIANA
jgi:nucleoside-diphosphate-sugar epimerase